MNRYLYVDIKNDLNIENPITSKSVDPYAHHCANSSCKLKEPLKFSFLELQA